MKQYEIVQCGGCKCWYDDKETTESCPQCSGRGIINLRLMSKEDYNFMMRDVVYINE